MDCDSWDVGFSVLVILKMIVAIALSDLDVSKRAVWVLLTDGSGN